MSNKCAGPVYTSSSTSNSSVFQNDLETTGYLYLEVSIGISVSEEGMNHLE